MTFFFNTSWHTQVMQRLDKNTRGPFRAIKNHIAPWPTSANGGYYCHGSDWPRRRAVTKAFEPLSRAPDTPPCRFRSEQRTSEIQTDGMRHKEHVLDLRADSDTHCPDYPEPRAQPHCPAKTRPASSWGGQVPRCKSYADLGTCRAVTLNFASRASKTACFLYFFAFPLSPPNPYILDSSR